MRKKLLITSVISGLFIVVLAFAILQNHPAFAKNQQTYVKTKVTGMARYSDPKKNPSTPSVRKSRLKQMNIVGEAATVLNILPIKIINEMNKGKTLAQIAQEKGLTEKEFTQKLSALESTTVNHAVSTGTIPLAQKEAINKGKSDRIKKALKTKGVNVHDHAPMDMGN